MEYRKPEIRQIGEAGVTIQSSQRKINQVVLDMPQHFPATTAAYEADE
jgi:hypothetical protein